MFSAKDNPPRYCTPHCRTQSYKARVYRMMIGGQAFACVTWCDSHTHARADVKFPRKTQGKSQQRRSRASLTPRAVLLRNCEKAPFQPLACRCAASRLPAVLAHAACHDTKTEFRNPRYGHTSGANANLRHTRVAIRIEVRLTMR